MSKEFLQFLEESKKVLAVDFDGVLHDDNRGYHDGTIYGKPIKDAEKALSILSRDFNIIVYTCKANPNRPLVRNKTGIQLVKEWLEIHEIDKYVTDVVWGKPNAVYYIDDRGITFTSWQRVLDILK